MTIKGTGDEKLDERLRALRAALRGLDGTDGRQIARRNARKRALGALRALRAEIDARWPAIITRAGVRRLKTFEGRLRRLTDKGWEVVQDPATLARFAEAGVPLRRVEGLAARDVRQGAKNGPRARARANAAGLIPPQAPRTRAATLVPGWAIDIGPDDPVRLKAAKRSNMEKRVARAEGALRD